MSDLPDFLKLPTPEAIEVFQAAFNNHTDPTPFDGRLVPNQWLCNERGITAKVAADFEAQIESLQRENEAMRSATNVIQQQAAAITPEMRERWHRVASLNPVAGIVYNEPDEEWPEDGEWVLIETESASGVRYETRVHDQRSWPSFGVRWAYISDLLGEQG